MKKPKKWTEVYPQGTKEGNEEQKFFIALVRDSKWSYKSISQLVQQTGLSQERVEEIIEKYRKMGLIFNHETNEDHWGYWERNPERIKKNPSLVRKDQDARIKKFLAQTPGVSTSDEDDED